MKKRLFRQFFLLAAVPLGLLCALLLIACACFAPERLPGLAALCAVFLAVLLPLSALIARLAAQRETERLAEALAGIDPESPACTAPELAPLAAKLRRQNDVIRSQFEQLRQEGAIRETQRREFTANVSHELKTPLTTISGTAEILRSGMVREEDVAHFADNIYRESQRMITLVSDIIRLSQLEEQKAPVPRERVDLHAVCEEVIGWLVGAAAKKQVTLTLGGGDCDVLGSEKILSDMVYNLCDNAIKYNRPGGSVEIFTREEGSQVRLSVSDTGIGIPREHQERVFERFYRVDKSHSREIGGTGLGLSIVKHGAIFHHAELELQSGVGSGTVITLRFPNPSQQEAEPAQ